MYFSLPSHQFADLLRAARMVVPTKATLPVVQTILFRVTPDGRTLEATSTDFDITFTQSFPLEEPGGPGSIAIQIAGLSAIRPDKKTPVRIDYAPLMQHISPETPNCQVLYVAGGQSASADLDICPVKEFYIPEHLPGPKDHVHFLPDKTLDAISASIAFQSVDETRYVLNGAYLDPIGGGCIVATCGRKLARWPSKTLPEPVILPRKACSLMSRLHFRSSAVAVIKTPERDFPYALSFRCGQRTLYTRVVEGNFPNYRQIIPALTETPAGITFSDPSGVARWLSSLDSDHAVHLIPRAPHYVDFRHPGGRISATAYLQNDPPEIAFNPSFLSTAMTTLPSGTLYLSDSTSPGVFRTPDGLAVLMPMRVTTPKTEETPV